MKNLQRIMLSATLAALAIIAVGCSFSTANMSSLKVSTDKEGTHESTSFKPGETIYAKAQISNNGGKVKVKLYLTSADNQPLKGSEVSVDIDGDRSADYNLPVVEGMPAGSYTLHADMINENGEKKDGKTAAIKVSE
jgi:hypothetical protein